MTEFENTDRESEDQTMVLDGWLVTGPALYGGAKLLYQVGKDTAQYLKSTQKLFIQVVESNIVKTREVQQLLLRIASTHIHGIRLNSFNIEGLQKHKLSISKTKTDGSDNVMGFDTRADSTQFRIDFPFSLRPNQTLDLKIEFAAITDTKIIRNTGINLICNYCIMDSLKSNQITSRAVQLFWE